MAIMKRSVERKIEEAYVHIKGHLNDTACVPLLHEMCSKCEMWCGTEEHDYSECRYKPCFICFLGFEYMEWCDSFNV